MLYFAAVRYKEGIYSMWLEGKIFGFGWCNTSKLNKFKSKFI